MRFDAETIKRNIDLLDLIGRDVHLKRVASTKAGEWAGPCPFCNDGEDRFRVWPNADKPGWWCRICEKSGDAIAYVMQRGGLDFRAACERLGGASVNSPRERLEPRPRRAEPGIPALEDLQARAAQIMIDCAAALWEPQGERARAWLNKRGLADETLKRHYIGYNDAGRRLHGFYVPRGITIPHWQASTNTLSGVKIRLSTNGPDKYRSIAGSRPSLYLADHLIGHDVAVICEGEFDALLLAQEVGDLVGVAALGSAAYHMTAIDAGLPFLLHVKRLLVATDNDQGGEGAAAELLKRTKRARRLRPPRGNDITNAWEAGVDLRAWVSEALAAVPLVQAAQALGGVVAGEPPPVERRVSLDDLGEYLSEHQAARVKNRE